MIKAVCYACSATVAALVVGALLSTHSGSLAANPAPSASPKIQPVAFSFDQIFPWVVAPAPSTSSSGALALSGAAMSAASGSAGVAAVGALQAANQLGPLVFDVDSVRAFSASQPAPGSNTATVSYTDIDQWVTGVAGLASSTGALGFTDNAASFDPIVGTHAGVLQLANQAGPFFFNLNVLKAIGFTQAPGNTLLPLPNGLNDNFSAVDIGRWSAGLPGVVTNTGTTGFVTSDNFTGGPPNDFRIGGLHTTTQVGAMTFDFNVLPAITTSLGPPSIAFSLAPDMTAAPTPFAGITPPTPGVVQPGGGLPIPSAVSAPAVSAPATAARVEETETSTPESPRSNSTPPVVIPGVNGAPLAKVPTRTPGAAGGNPFSPITDAFTNGINTITTGIGALNGATAGTTSPGGAGAGGPDSSATGSGAG